MAATVNQTASSLTYPPDSDSILGMPGSTGMNLAVNESIKMNENKQGDTANSMEMNGNHVNSNNSPNNNNNNNNNNNTSLVVNAQGDNVKENWGFSLSELYKLASTFIKEKEGKAMHLSYKDKLAFVAYSQQIVHGKYVPEKSPPVGYLDVIGRDRRQAWAALDDMSKEQAMEEYVKLLDSVCPLFRPYVQAHKCDLEEKERIRRQQEEERRREEEEERERQRQEEAMRQKEEEEKKKQAEQKRLIQEALNRQTYHQFKAYAEQQYPGNPDEQAILIRQLQEQHYQQYMQQVFQQQVLETQQLQDQQQSTVNNQNNNSITNEMGENTRNHDHESSGAESSEDDSQAASMWTRKDIKEFKDSIRKEGGDGIIKVGHGETVTVRVPTHENGTCLFWEFATDNYDIGFGVYFEWNKNPGHQVSVHISESEDEEEEEEEQETGIGDVEKGVPAPDRPPVSVIIPVYRRDCHEEVYAGSHVYPGQGIYLLKFDNSYSLWRSKTLYYRVYYTR